MQPQLLQKCLPALRQVFLQSFRAITVRAGPWLCPIQVAAVLAVVGLFDTDQLEIFLPIRPLFLQRRGAETGFDPMRCAIFADPRMLKIVNIFVARNGSASQRAVLDGTKQILLPPMFNPGFD